MKKTNTPYPATGIAALVEIMAKQAAERAQSEALCTNAIKMHKGRQLNGAIRDGAKNTTPDY